jgi:uncharacterized protein (TIRG00374 family)
MKRNIITSLLLGFLLSATGFYLAFRNVPANDLITYLIDINYFWILPSFGLVVLSFVIRVIRWQVILAPAKKIGFWSAFHPVMIAFTINCILPGRLGELARPAILMKKENIRYSTGLATVAVERAFDISLIMALFMIAYQFINIDPNIHIPIGRTVLNRDTLETIVTGMFQISILLILGMILVSFQWSRSLIKQMIFKIPGLLFFTREQLKQKITQRICAPLVRLIDNFAIGFELIRSPVKILVCLGLSMLIWVLVALSYYIFALGCPGIEITLSEMTAVMVIICIFIALPSVPGYWGLWEAGGIFALTLFGVSQKEAAGFTLANHAMQIFPVIMIGVTSAIVTGVNIWRTSFDVRHDRVA